MKICITTVFKTENCGSFLQAWALKEQLSAGGHEAYFRDYKKTFDSRLSKITGIIKCCLRLRLRRAWDMWRRSADFKCFQKQLKVADSKENDADLYIFGSDTLWNFEDKFFRDNAPFFTGADIQKPCYTYAMSLGSTSQNCLVENYVAVKGIQKFKGIAVRDQHTQDVLSGIYPQEKMCRTVDPTMLWDKETYLAHFSAKLPYAQKSLVVYYFGRVPDALWTALKAFARKKGLAIVNVGLDKDHEADMSVVGSPAKFISAFASAEYIFTNTFHGCVFSTIFNKQFATDGAHKKKIEGFIREFSLIDRIVSAAEDVEKVLTRPVDYDRVNALVKEGRERSGAYLNGVIAEVKDYE